MVSKFMLKIEFFSANDVLLHQSIRQLKRITFNYIFEPYDQLTYASLWNFHIFHLFTDDRVQLHCIVFQFNYFVKLFLWR